VSAPVRICALLPSYDNPATVRATVLAVRAHLPDVLLVDDGSGPEGQAACAAIAAEGLAQLERRPVNGGKGAAVKTGLQAARARGYTHVFQIDSDGQHDVARIPEFLEVARAHPDVLLMGYPVYDASAPLSRRFARRWSAFWIGLEVGDRDRIRDALVGFRVYPVAAALAAGARTDRMDFDVEIAVRMAWAGTPVINLPVGVRYLSAAQGGVSHFRMVRDNVAFVRLHVRLCAAGAVSWAQRRRAARPGSR
jgi:polyprenyl-phospho-N-acetylgalactosaminyl synthase